MRQCVGCGEMKGKKEMLRVLKTPEGDMCWMQPEKTDAVLYICKKPGLPAKRRKKNRGLERSFQMSIPDEVYDSLEKEFGESETE